MLYYSFIANEKLKKSKKEKEKKKNQRIKDIIYIYEY